MRRDDLEEPGDDVRTVRLPPTAGPHYRNLALAAAALLLLLGVLIFVTPMQRGSEEPRTAPEPPASTFLDEPPVEPSEEAPPAVGPWWKRFAGAPAAESSPPTGEDAFRAWPEEGLPDAAASSIPTPPDPRREALTRALKSSALKRPGVAPPAPGLTAEAAGLDPMLVAAARTLPTSEDVARLLAAARGPAETSHSTLSLTPPPASDESLTGLANPTLAALGAYALPATAPGSADPPRGASSSLAHGSAFQAVRSPPVSPRTLRAGTLIPVRLETAIDSDAPGPVAARVLRDVTDSATGGRVLIPAGALLLGSVGSQLPVGRNRALVAFERLLWPGVSYEIPGFEALETTGTRGLSDRVDHHTFALLGRATLLAAVGAAFEIAQPDRNDGASLAAGDVAAARMALELDRVASRILERGLDRQPTVKVRSGERFYIYLHRDLEL